MSDRKLPVSPRRGCDRDKPRTRIEDESAIEEVYKMGDVLGRGSFGVVKEVTNRADGRQYAMKIINKDKPGSMSIQLLDREIEVLNRVNHPHIIQLIEVYENQKRVFLILEMCRGGELSDMLKEKGRFQEDDVKVIMRQLAEAVVYMHSKDMVHRDLKLENILLSTKNTEDPYNIKVADFGLSHMKGLNGDSDDLMHSRCGTLHYMAPEVLRNKHEYSKLCDVWSMGVIMYRLLCGRMPFNGDTANHLEESIMLGHIEFKEPEWISIGDQAKELIQGMLNTDTVKRLTARQVLEDPWITGSNEKQRIDPFKMLMDDSPNPSPPQTRPADLKDKSSANHTPSSNTLHPNSCLFSGADKNPTHRHQETKKSLPPRSSVSTSKLSSPPAGGSKHGGSFKKRHASTQSTGQLPRASTAQSGGTRGSSHGERKLTSARR